MPIALDPAETCPVYLRSDADKPEAERPAFLFHYLTRRELRQWQELYAKADVATTDEEVEPILDKMLAIGLAGWQNVSGRDGQPIPFAPDRLDDVLTGTEKLELAVVYPRAVAALEQKKRQQSASPSGPLSEKSAPDAPEGSAATPPPNANP